jgi:hypothetical protein
VRPKYRDVLKTFHPLRRAPWRVRPAASSGSREPRLAGGFRNRYARDLRPLAAGSARRDFFLAPQAALRNPPHRLGSPVDRVGNRARQCGARRRGSPERGDEGGTGGGPAYQRGSSLANHAGLSKDWERTAWHVRWTQPGSENPSGGVCTEGSSSEPAADEQEEKPAGYRATGGRGGPEGAGGMSGHERRGGSRAGTSEAKPQEGAGESGTSATRIRPGVKEER